MSNYDWSLAHPSGLDARVTCAHWSDARPRWIKTIAQQAFSDVRPGHLGDRCTLAVSPNGPCVRDGNLAGAHRALGTTVFRSKFFQISRASLPNSMTRCAASFPHTATNLLQPMNPTKYAAFVAGRLPQLTDTVCLPNKLAIFHVNSIWAIFPPLELEWQSCISRHIYVHMY